MTITDCVNITFQSDRFNTTEERDYFVNPNCFGDDFCRFMIGKLKERGVKCDDEPCGEDWGWLIAISFDDKTYDFCTNYIPGEHWLAFIKPFKGFWNNLFGKGNKEVPQALVEIILEILRAEDGITEINWERDESRS